MSKPTARQIISDLGKIVNPGGIQETFKTMIGGVEQWVYTRGQDRKNPIILFLHGGPASPMSPVMWMYQRPIEEYFTVVNWDQRASGRTYLEADPHSLDNTINIAQFVNDTIELAELIQDRYGAKKVILIGHSWGTIIGLRAALARPELFSVYVGMGQVINSRDNERVSYDHAVSEAQRTRNKKALAELEAIAPYPGQTPPTPERIIVVRKWVQYYGGLSAFRTEAGYYFWAPLLSPEYDHKAVSALDQGSIFTLERILPEILDLDFKGIAVFPIPILMFMGRHDCYTPSKMTEDWLKKVKAPYKKGIWFERSAHLIPLEEPGKTLMSLVRYVRPIAVNAERHR